MTRARPQLWGPLLLLRGLLRGPSSQAYSKNGRRHPLSHVLCREGETHLIIFVFHLAHRRISITARHRVQRPTHVYVVFPPCAVLTRIVHGIPVSSTTTVEGRCEGWGGFSYRPPWKGDMRAGVGQHQRLHLGARWTGLEACLGCLLAGRPQTSHLPHLNLLLPFVK